MYCTDPFFFFVVFCCIMPENKHERVGAYGKKKNKKKKY